MSDYEQASINAFKAVYPDAVQRGCFFHFAQAIFKHIQADQNLHEKYNEDSNFSLQLRQLIALAFIPPCDVDASFDQLQSSDFFKNNEELLDGYLKYFATTWIGSYDRRGARKRPLYDIGLWNCYESVLEDLPKTNNACEGFHRGFATMLAACHPTIHKLVDALLKQQALTTCTQELLINKKSDPPIKKWVDVAASLKKKVENYGKIGVLEYLRGVEHNINKI